MVTFSGSAGQIFVQMLGPRDPNTSGVEQNSDAEPPWEAGSLLPPTTGRWLFEIAVQVVNCWVPERFLLYSSHSPRHG
jgi:hypothetical protein